MFINRFFNKHLLTSVEYKKGFNCVYSRHIINATYNKSAHCIHDQHYCKFTIQVAKTGLDENEDFEGELSAVLDRLSAEE